MNIFNPFYWLYDYLFVNHSIDDQENERLADLALISYYKKKLYQERLKQTKIIKV